MTITIDPAVDPGDLSRTGRPTIVEYARHLEALNRQSEDLKGLEDANLSAAISETEKRILAMPASTAVDAAIQIMLVFSRIGQLRVNDGSAEDALLGRLEGLASSALGGLTRQLDLDLSDLGGSRYAPSLVGPPAHCDD